MARQHGSDPDRGDALPTGQMTRPVANIGEADPTDRGRGPDRLPGGLLSWSVRVVAAAVVVVTAALVVVVLVQTTRAPGPAAHQSGRAEFLALESLVAQSAPARRAVVTAVDSVRACSMDPRTGAEITQAAIAARQGVTAELDHLDLSAVPANSALREQVAAAMAASIAADRNYSHWMADLVVAGVCNTSSISDPAYDRAAASSATATEDKTRLADTWNRISSGYNLSPESPEDL